MSRAHPTPGAQAMSPAIPPAPGHSQLPGPEGDLAGGSLRVPGSRAEVRTRPCCPGSESTGSCGHPRLPGRGRGGRGRGGAGWPRSPACSLAGFGQTRGGPRSGRALEARPHYSVTRRVRGLPCHWAAGIRARLEGRVGVSPQCTRLPPKDWSPGQEGGDADLGMRAPRSNPLPSPGPSPCRGPSWGGGCCQGPLRAGSPGTAVTFKIMSSRSTATRASTAHIHLAFGAGFTESSRRLPSSLLKDLPRKNRCLLQ